MRKLGSHKKAENRNLRKMYFLQSEETLGDLKEDLHRLHDYKALKYRVTN